MNKCIECKYHKEVDFGDYKNDICEKINGYNAIINFEVMNGIVPFHCPFNGKPQSNETKDKTIDDCIEYFQTVLTEGGVSGTDFELNEEETEIYKMTISALNILKATGGKQNEDS